MSKKGCIILAAGDGKRMNSDKPKVLAKVLFKPMLDWVLDSVKKAGIEDIAIIVGSGHEQIESHLSSNPEYNNIKTFMQSERKGTGHAVMQAKPFIEELSTKGGSVLILCGDAPFMDSDTINKGYEILKGDGCFNSVTITADLDDPTAYGRIVYNPDDNTIKEIVEHKDCDEKQLLITEVNSGAHWFDAKEILETLPKLSNNNNNNEYYLTEAVGLIPNAAAYKTPNTKVTLGANDRRGLRTLNKIASETVIEKHLENGVDIIGESFITDDVTISKDSVILAGTIIKGKTTIGKGCIIGPNSLIENCIIGDDVVLNNVQAFDSVIEDGGRIGPFVHIRPNCKLHKDIKIGDFVEVKNSVVGEKTSIAHLSYIGDSDVGRGVNFGCGCVTANYDGINKYRTVIGNDAFIGCNTNLIAPVKIGDNATTAAGSTITKEVPADSLAIERGETVIRENWAKNSLRKKK